MKPEAKLEKELSDIAGYFGCAYIKIPDTKMINAKNRHIHKEEKRPFDGILVTPNNNFCIECKINSGKLLPHQENNGRLIDNINQSFYIIRKRIRKYDEIYTIEDLCGNILLISGVIEHVIYYFKELKEEECI